MPKSFLLKFRRLTVSRFQKAGIKVDDRSHLRVETVSRRFNAAACSVIKKSTPCWFSLIKHGLSPELHFRAQYSAARAQSKRLWLFSDLFMS